MYGKRCNSNILQPLCKFHYNLGVLVPAQSGLYGYRQFYSLHYHFGYLHHLLRVAHHSGACASAGDLAYRAAEVYIYKVCACASGKLCSPLCHLRCLHHCLRDVAVNLYAYRLLVGVGDKFCQRLAAIPYETVGGDKLRVHHICAKLLAYIAEGGVCHILHRCKQQRIFA